VAQAAGVSITTVSHVLSGKRPVNVDTVLRVRAVADKLGYRARPSALGLATGRSMTLALQVTLGGSALIFNPSLGLVLTEVSRAALELGYSFVLVPTRPKQAEFMNLLADGSSIDGVVLLDPVADDPFVDAVRRSGIPVVALGRTLDRFPAHRVVPRLDLAFARVYPHLRERGYERPAALSFASPIAYIADFERVFREYAGAQASVLISKDNTVTAAADEVARLLAADDPPDALVCATDQLAVGAVRAAEVGGVAVPDALAVVALTDSELSEACHPSITALHLDTTFAGRTLMALIDEVIADPGKAPIEIPMRADFMIRGSSMGPRPASPAQAYPPR
jgi:DNA-binding LacI/PurR family transcriptional regulator